MNFSSPVLNLPQEGKRNRTKLIRLRNGHYRRIVDVSNIEDIKKLTDLCRCVCTTPRNDDLDKQEKLEKEKKDETSKDHDEKSDFVESEIEQSFDVEIKEDDTIDDQYSRSISLVSNAPTSIKGETVVQRRKMSQLELTEEESNEEIIESADEVKEDLQEEKEEIKEEKEKIQEKIPRPVRKLIEPSKTLMKGIKTNIYFLSNKEMVQTTMCYNYNCNAVVFEKDTFLRYLYIKSISNIILNERMIEELCKQEDLKYVLSSNSIVIESTDFLKPLIIEFESSVTKKVFVTHIKFNERNEIDIKKYHEYLNEININEKLRLLKVERFHSFNKMVQNR
ncbi:hypothetical protein, conserved [Plasmodium gonderi]|uniref:Uncharacterized protein n=1 Tax=Plasmodium gonderi TaxID=77519 RepID=A0A1Y1JNJ1_PLAGO|nr:hypothetical protein, conserved [Plasmodium gonderi]GAW82807.1 hypothetical protein, conserved [Plasmodium gonderi]